MSNVRAVELAPGPDGADLLVLGPSLGTSVTALWQDVVALLGDRFHIIGWDLPGHGVSEEPTAEVTFDGLAADVLGIVETHRRAGQRCWYAAVSAGAATGLQAILEEPGVFAGAVLIGTGAKIGEASAWNERARVVDTMGTPSQVEGSARRWFAPGFVAAQPEVATRLLASLQTAGPRGYSAVCRALAQFDVRDRLGEINVPLIAVAGEHDQPTPVSNLAFIAAHTQHSRLQVIDGVAHLAPAEAPDAVAAAILTLTTLGIGDAFELGMAVRREVLGAEHVGKATENATALTAPFQQFITETAWGGVWARPGLDRRMRSAVTLTALVAGHHWNELAMHVRAARRNGLSDIEIREVLLQCAVYCSVPSANHALAIAAEVFAEPHPNQA